MSSSWRHFSKGLFYFSFVICLLGSAVGGIICWANSSNVWYGVNEAMLALGFELFFGGIFITLIAHSIWGMMLEYFYNAAEDRESKQNYSNNPAPVVTPSLNAPSYNPPRTSSYEQINIKEGWICPNCDALNDKSAWYCRVCGQTKPENAKIVSPAPVSEPASESSEDWWICPNCDKQNNSSDRYCKSCKQTRPESAKPAPDLKKEP